MENKILKWQRTGLINEQTAQTMLEEIKEDKARLRKARTNITIYTIAAILLGIGVITFISANDWILEFLNSSRLLKILLMSILTIGIFQGGCNLSDVSKNKKSFPKLGQALIVLSSILIGATYAVIGQVYNINADSSLLMFIWLISIIPLAYLFKSLAINTISIIIGILGIIFFYNELAIDKLEVWTVYIPVMCGCLLYTLGNIPKVLNKFNNFSLSYKIVGAVSIFITLIILTCSVEKSYNLLSFYYLAPIALLITTNILNYIFQKEKTNILYVETYSTIVLLIFLMTMLVVPAINVPFVMFLANIGLILMISFGFNSGYKFENEKIITTANWLLTIYLTVNYCRWGWSFMDKSLFFIFGGICLLSLGMFLEKKKKQTLSLRKEQ